MQRGSVTQWISQVREGRSFAAEKLWNRYEQRMLALASRHIANFRLIVADEQDIANDALGSLLMKMREGEYGEVGGRDDLWKLLATITINKANSLIRNQTRLKRDVRKRSETFSGGKSGNFQLVSTKTETPESKLLFAEAVNEFLSLLQDDELQEITLAKLEGYTNEEIGKRIGRSIPTVERRMRLIRSKFSHYQNVDLSHQES